VYIEGTDAVIHGGCRVYLPAQGPNVPLGKSTPEPRRVGVPVKGVVLIGQMSGQTWYHYLCECLPRLLLMMPTLSEEELHLPLLLPPMEPFTLRALRYFTQWKGLLRDMLVYY